VNLGDLGGDVPAIGPRQLGDDASRAHPRALVPRGLRGNGEHVGTDPADLLQRLTPGPLSDGGGDQEGSECEREAERREHRTQRPSHHHPQGEGDPVTPHA
jgi:hypothetical protein